MFKSDDRYRTLIFIFIMGLVLRILFAFYLENKIYWDDGFDYDGLATRLLEGKGYVNSDGMATSFRAPGYPFFLALVYLVFGHHFLAVRVIQSILDSLTIIIIASITKLIFNQKAGNFSAFIYTIYPLFVYTAGTFFPTTLFIFLLSSSMFSLFKTEKKPTLLNAVFLGIAFGISALTVPTVLVFFPLALLWLYFNRQNNYQKAILNTGMTVLSLILILSPWIIRNYHVHSKPVLIATNSGYNFWMGNNQWATASSGNTIQRPEYLLEALNQAGSETEKESIYYQDAFKFIKKHPGQFVNLTFQKALNLWRLYPDPGTGYKTKALLSKIVGAVSYAPVLILAILGIILLWHQKKKYIVLLILLFFSFTIMHAFFIAKVRFRLPLDPYLIVLAGYVLSELKLKVFKLS